MNCSVRKRLGARIISAGGYQRKPFITLNGGSWKVSTAVPVTVAMPVAFVVVDPVSSDAIATARMNSGSGVVAVGSVEAVDRWMSVRISCWEKR